MRQRSASDGRVCFCLCGVQSMGMRFIRVSSDMVGHCLGEKKKKRDRDRIIGQSSILRLIDRRDRPPKPSIQTRDFPKDCNLFRAIQSQSQSLVRNDHLFIFLMSTFCSMRSIQIMRGTTRNEKEEQQEATPIPISVPLFPSSSSSP